MAIQKQFLKSKKECKVTFSLALEDAQTVQVCGAFNNWNGEKLPLKKLKNGTFKGSIKLPLNNSYEFKYLVNGTTWINENDADDLVWNDYAASKNSLIEL